MHLLSVPPLVPRNYISGAVEYEDLPVRCCGDDGHMVSTRGTLTLGCFVRPFLEIGQAEPKSFSESCSSWAWQVVRGGIYLTGPFKGFVSFPATQDPRGQSR